MKKFMLCAFAATLIVSCQNSADNQEKSTGSSADNPDLTAYGIENSTHPKGLKIGDTVPDIAMQTSDLKEITIKELYNDRPLVVIFYRGYWCPVCNKHLSEFAARAAEIENAGARIIAVTPESYDKADITIEKTGMDFTVISDIDGSVMKAFDVQFDVTEDYHTMIEDELNASITETNASKSAVLPVPATFIIDTNGKVVYRQFNPDYKERASIDDILNNLPLSEKE
ncbi:peroxiredoxin-like family protein [Parapedobacter tibetensis]|uniref:peroxiredoxin-like family protein n=1 Tax=Parapedobacter tibetensis TaxID=2972951 RepID=UPI00214DEBC5|nr:peroxiredoxin-like family protein [Parapedobacter tibetensis]